MSLARFSETSDVYVYEHADGGYACCGCLLAAEPFAEVRFTGAGADNGESQMAAHMREHRKAGHQVPQQVFDRLRKAVQHA